MRTLKDLFGVEKPLIAMCHLEGLPGRPRYDAARGLEAIVESARREVKALQDGGVDAILFCNENDIPYSTSVGMEAVATMTHVIGRLRGELRVPYGTNLLWDPAASVAAAVASGASFIREVLTGVYDCDMGLLAPDLGAVAGYRHAHRRRARRDVRQHHPGVQPLGRRAHRRRARRQRRLPGRRCAADLRAGGRRRRQHVGPARGQRGGRDPGAGQHRRQARDRRRTCSRSPTARSSARASRSTATPGTRSTPSGSWT